MTVPKPPERLKPRLAVWPAGDPIERVYRLRHGPTAFHSGVADVIGGRFHWFRNAAGVRVPVLYGAEDTNAALFETVFHDAPRARPAAINHWAVIEERGIVTLAATRDLHLIELLALGLQRLGLKPDEITSTPPTEYRGTVAWAQALHAAAPKADGIVWMSRQFNTSRALMLFGDRVASAELAVIRPPLPLSFGPGYDLVEQMADAADITLI